MVLAPIFKKAYWSLAVLATLYCCFLLLLLNPSVQRHLLYLHVVNTNWWLDSNQPERFGFLKNQVTPFQITTPDDEQLYAWHVLPLSLYAQHEGAILRETGLNMQRHFGSTRAFKLLAQDPESKLVISFHGNAGTVSQGYRTDSYHNLASSHPNIHVIAVDYRGYGHSTGSPSEAGVITDGIATIDYALKVLGIAPERIVIYGQSLGTAVSIAVAEHFRVERRVEFKGMVLVAPFESLPSLVLDYAIGGVIPLLSPLRQWPKVQEYFAAKTTETWFSATRLANLVKASRDLRLYLIHAENDYNVPWRHSEALFQVAANATSEEGMTGRQIDAAKGWQELGRGERISTWKAAGAGEREGGVKYIEQHIVAGGGHNRITTYPVVGKAVLNAFEGRP